MNAIIKVDNKVHKSCKRHVDLIWNNLSGEFQVATIQFDFKKEYKKLASRHNASAANMYFRCGAFLEEDIIINKDSHFLYSILGKLADSDDFPKIDNPDNVRYIVRDN